MDLEDQLTKGCVLPRDWLLGVSSGFVEIALQNIVEEYRLTKKDRHSPVKFRRQYFAWFCRTKLHLTYEHIGRLVKRDHATIIHARKTIDNMIQTKDNTYLNYTADIHKDLNKLL